MNNTHIGNNPLTGALYLLRGMRMIAQPGLRRFVILPLLINVAIFGLLGYLAFGWLNSWTEQLVAGFPEWLQWIEWLFTILILLALGLLILFTFTLLANLVSAPFNGPLAEAVERQARGRANLPEAPWHQALAELPATFRDEWQKLRYSLLRSLPFLVLFIIPGVNLLASAAWLLFSAWLLALQYAEYPMSNHRLNFAQQREALKQRRLLVLGFGGAVMLGTLIPVLNLLIVPSAVAGATLLYLEAYQPEEALENDTPAANAIEGGED